MRKFFLSPILIAFVATSSNAVSIEKQASNFDIEFVEGNQLILNANASVATIDNFLYEQSGGDSTTEISLNPSVFLQAHNETHLGQFFGEVINRQYGDFDEDDHTDKSVLAKYFYKLASDHRAFVSLSFDEIYEFRGRGLTKGIASSVDKGDTVESTLINAGYQYGRVDSVSRLNALLGQKQIEYSTRKSLTQLYKNTRDFVLIDLDYLVGAKTYLSFSAEYNQYEYENNSALDKDVIYAIGGIKWKPSAASELDILIGTEQIKFNSNQSDESKFKWRLNYNWMPFDYFNFSISSGRATDTKAELGSDFKVSDSYTASANYKINEFFSYKISASLIASEISLEEQIRNEDSLRFLTGLQFRYSEKFNAYIDFSYNELESDVVQFEFDRSQITVGCNISF
ncbi:hypothetical protein HII17_17435 [Thalassotalea sp. M1531]|uniref:DUF560 domain-containing protein n=1 Tax=Thalassotalea algicola TaxID=2716224 RepID=A0A7Y0Q8K7_9GAMM|nr:hypothetical protein [Thalassotalea algicola]NMP33336.1 hypothetical protein [Thalassotalea algicola]